MCTIFIAYFLQANGFSSRKIPKLWEDDNIDISEMCVRQVVDSEFQLLKDYLSQLGMIDILPMYSAKIFLVDAIEVTDYQFHDNRVFDLNFIIRLYKDNTFLGAGDCTFYLDLTYINTSDTIEEFMYMVLTAAFFLGPSQLHLAFDINKYTVSYLSRDQIKQYIDFLNALAVEEPLFEKRWPLDVNTGLADEMDEEVWSPNEVVFQICWGLMHYAPNRQMTENFSYLVDSLEVLNPVFKTNLSRGFVLRASLEKEHLFFFEKQIDGSYILVDAPHKMLDEYTLIQTLMNN